MLKRGFLSLLLAGLAGCKAGVRQPLAQAAADEKLVEGPAFLFGTVTYHERIGLPRNAELQVVLSDVSDSRGVAPIVRTMTLKNLGDVPIAFALRYDPNEIDERRLYALRANVTANGRLLYESKDDYFVLTRGNSGRADIVVVSTSEPS